MPALRAEAMIQSCDTESNAFDTSRKHTISCLQWFVWEDIIFFNRKMFSVMPSRRRKVFWRGFRVTFFSMRLVMILCNRLAAIEETVIGLNSAGLLGLLDLRMRVVNPSLNCSGHKSVRRYMLNLWVSVGIPTFVRYAFLIWSRPGALHAGELTHVINSGHFTYGYLCSSKFCRFLHHHPLPEL